MGGDVYGGGLGAVAMPAVFDAGDAFAVEVGGSFGLGLIAEDAGVEGGDCDEDRQRRQQPPWGECTGVEVRPEFGNRGDYDQEAEVPEADVHFFELRGLGFTSALELLVLLCR